MQSANLDSLCIPGGSQALHGYITASMCIPIRCAEVPWVLCCCVWESVISLSGLTTSSPVLSLLAFRADRRKWSCIPYCTLRPTCFNRQRVNTDPAGNIHQSTFLSVHLAQSWCLCQSQTRDARPGQLWQFLDDIRPENEWFHLAVNFFFWIWCRMQNL